MNQSTPLIGRAQGRIALIAAGSTVGAVAGAYLNWLWWEIGYRPLTIVLAIVILVAGGVGLMIPRVVGRRIAIAGLAVGFGILAGQHVGPDREPIIHRPGGTMALRLESPIVAVATGTAECDTVASGTELVVLGVPEPPEGEPGLPDGIIVQLGDRWAYPRDNARADRVRLEIGVTTQLVPGSNKVLNRIGMAAEASSTLESTFTTEGGSIRFRDLVALGEPEYTGDSMDLAGTFEWTCGPAGAIGHPPDR
jgi:hypothetical protein